MKTINSYITKNPWIYIVLAFVMLLTAWSTLITVAMKYSPQQIELKH